MVSIISSIKAWRFLSNVVTVRALRRKTGSGRVMILRRAILLVYLQLWIDRASSHLHAGACFSFASKGSFSICSASRVLRIPDFTLNSDSSFSLLLPYQFWHFRDRSPAIPPCARALRSPLPASFYPYALRGGGQYPI